MRRYLSGRINAAIRHVPIWLVWTLGLLPLALLISDTLKNQLGVDPIPKIEHRLGRTALYFLIAGLAMTPLQRLAAIRLLPYRRAIGLLAFTYICLHISAWALLDMGMIWAQVLRDIFKRPYLLVGMSAFVALLPLALTSNNWSIRRMGGVKWRHLHRLVYLAVPLAGLHYLWVGKLVQPAPLLWLTVTMGLLVLRLSRR